MEETDITQHDVQIEETDPVEQDAIELTDVELTNQFSVVMELKYEDLNEILDDEMSHKDKNSGKISDILLVWLGKMSA